MLRKLPRSVLVLLVVVVVALVLISLYSGLSGPSTSGSWISAYSYPLKAAGVPGVVGQACVESAGYAYCVGGEDFNDDPTSSVYYAPISSSGVGNWTLSANPYPMAIVFQACATSSGYVYCVGGTKDSQGDDTAASYYAPLSPAGAGPWVASTPYPVAVDALSCVTAAGGIYCVGGENETAGTSASAVITNSVWFAPVSAQGIGAWSQSVGYPAGIYYPNCTGAGSYVYCVGGENAKDDPQNATYYSYVTSSGMGAWAAAPGYPIQTIGESCATSYSVVYCVGGFQSGGATTAAVYSASVTSSGMEQWKPAPSYPLGVATDCVAGEGYVYCIGGYSSSTGEPTGDSYYAVLNGGTSGSS